MDHQRGRLVRAVRRYDDEIGELNWAATQDMPCEVEVLWRTGLSVRDYQRRTVENFAELQMLWADPISSPVIQGMSLGPPAMHGHVRRGRRRPRRHPARRDRVGVPP